MYSAATIIRIATVALLLLAHSIASAQEATPPSAAGSAAAPGATATAVSPESEPPPSAATSEAATPESQPWAAARAQIGLDRLELSDAWMEHLDTAESADLRSRRPWGYVYSALYAALWTGFAIYYRNDEHLWLVRGALIGAAAANVGFLIAQAYLDVYDQYALLAWSSAANYVFLGTGIALSTSDDDCGHDCKLIDFTVAGVIFAQALAQIVVNLLMPPIYITQHYREYQQLPAAERPEFALALLRAQEDRHREETYVSVALSALSGAALIFAATQARSDSSQWLGYVVGGLMIGGGVVNLVELTLETQTSERLLAGELPPRPTAF